MIHRQVIAKSTCRFDLAIEQLTQIERSSVTQLIHMGGAYLQKKRHKNPSTLVRAGQLIEAYYQLPISVPSEVFDAAWVLQDQDHYLIANKPSGIPTQGRRTCDLNCFYEALKRNLNGYLGLHHRLDQDTSGLLFFSRSRQANRDVANLFSQRLMRKKYLTVVRGPWPAEDDSIEINAPIGRQSTHCQPTRQVISQQGKQAITRVDRLASEGDLILLQAQPITGRTHQIRVHLQYVGLPILGDRLYGDTQEHPMLLHCEALSWPQYGHIAAGSAQCPPPPWWGEALPGRLTAAYAMRAP